MKIANYHFHLHNVTPHILNVMSSILDVTLVKSAAANK